MWLKELNFWTLLQIWFTLRVQPIWTFSYDSTNWTYFTWLKELNLIELSLKELNLLFHDSKNWTLFWRDSMNWIFFCDPKNWTFFVECDPKNWIIVEKHEELILFTNMTENWTLFEPFHMTRRNDHFLKWLKELNLFECDSKNWNFSTKSESKNGFLECDSKNWKFSIWLKELNMTHRIEHLFSRIWRTELNISFLEYDSQIFLYDSQNWTPELNIFLKRLKELFFTKVTQRIELIFWKYNPQDWTLSLIWSKERIEILWYDTKDWIFLIWHTEPYTFFNITQRIEPFSPTDSKKWTFLFDKIWPKGLIFSDITQRTEHFFECDSKNWTPLKIWLTELNPFWTIWLIEIEPFSTWVKENDSIKEWLKDFLLVCKMHDSKNELIVLGKYDWELKFLKEKRTLRIEPFQKLTRWIEPSVLHDPKNWTFFLYNSKDWTFS